MTFTFKHGDRPLEGYTVQRGVGRGGFGEVYYAVADSGKEVALKYLRDNPQTELRGVNQCLNLKSPYLITIYDVKQNDEGDYFVLMEYVSGPSLREMLLDAPEGLGADKAVFFTDGIAKGLRYLHEQGIVHRDLKPGNIFYEDGYVKIGDYGLSKFISASQHSAQTMSVGTVHYMAPEIGSGHYQPGTDIYALGVMLYEMLLGRVPFQGSSMGEILMKHLTEQPEVDALPEPFPAVIRKALAKDPTDRYQSVDEMTAELFGQSELRNTLSGFDVSTLSVRAERVAERVAARAAVGAGGTGSSQYTPLHDDPAYDNTVTYHGHQPRLRAAAHRVSEAAGRFGEKMGQAATRFGEGFASLDSDRKSEPPAFPQRSRLVAGFLGVFLGPFGIHRFYLGYVGTGICQILVTIFTAGTGGLWGMIEGVVILFGGSFTDVHGRPLVWAYADRRSAFVRTVWGVLSTIFLLGTLALVLVPLFVAVPRLQSEIQRELGMQIQPGAPPLAFLWAIAALVLTLGVFFVWKAAHGPGYSFWHATLRPGVLAVCTALVGAAVVFGSAYGAEREQTVMLIVIGFFAALGGSVWQIRGAIPPSPRDHKAYHAVVAWVCVAVAGLAGWVWIVAVDYDPERFFASMLGFRNAGRDVSFGGYATVLVSTVLTVCLVLEALYQMTRAAQAAKHDMQGRAET